MNTIQRIQHKLKNDGIRTSFQDFISFAYDHYYDYKYNLDTYSWVSNDELTQENETATHASAYQAVKVLSLRQLLKTLRLNKDVVFVDIGSGKGRILLIASEFGYMEARGIELSKKLCDVAEQNLINYQTKIKTSTQIKIINADASEYKISADENIFFLYNPFDEHIMRKVLDNISLSHQENDREILLIYAYPVKSDVVESYKNIRKINDYYFWSFQYSIYKFI